MDWPGRRNDKAENDSDHAWFNHGREGFVRVNTGLLRITTTNPPSLLAGERAIGVEFMPENPFPGDNIGAMWTRNEGPGVVEEEGVILVFHGMEPVWIEKGSLVGTWDGRDRLGNGGEVQTIGRKMKTSLAARAHVVGILRSRD